MSDVFGIKANTALNDIVQQKADVSYVDNKFASATPKGAYATLTDLQTAHSIDDGNVYIVTANGHIYDWISGAWADTGLLYQATGIANSSINSEMFIDTVITPVTPTWTTGYYINSSGSTITQSGWQYSNPITLKKGQTLSFTGKGTSTSVSMISRTYSNKLYPLVVCTDSTEKQFSYTATCDCSVVLSTNTTSGNNIRIYSNPFIGLSNTVYDVKTIKEDITSTITYTNDKYINTSGSIASNTSYKYSSPIALKYCETLEFIGRAETTVAMLSSCSSSGTNITPIVIGNGLTADQTATYTNTSFTTVYLIVCSRVKEYDFIVNKKTTPSTLADEIKNNVSFIRFKADVVDYSALFKKVVCIGDSLTQGYYAEYPSGSRNRSYGYPSALAQMTNWNVTNLGVSGATPSSWWTDHSTTSFADYECAFICLGRNGDLVSTDDQTAYNSIIQKIKADNSNCIIFVCAVPPSNNNNEDSINTIIQSIATANSVYYLDIHTNNVMTVTAGAIYRPTDGVHFNKIGYLTLAETILDNMKKFISENLSLFTSLFVAQ